MDLLIRNGQVIDPYNHQEQIADILINAGKIVDIGAGIVDNISATRVIDAAGKLVTPGLIDMHVHLREPGGEEKETIATGTRAAAQGGFTTIACMPNTCPVIDNQSLVEFILAKSKQEGVVRVLPIGAISKGLKGEELAEIGQMVKSGAKAISDDGRPIENAVLMRRALEYVKQFNIPVISHCEDLTLSDGGCMNEGYYSTILGLPGIPSSAEDIMVARDIILAEETGTRLHIAHVSTRKSVELVRQAKKRGVTVTCEATPHHFTLTDKAVCGLGMQNAECGMQGFDTNTKMNSSQLSTPNSQLSTPNSQLSTPNSQLSTPNSQLPTLNSQLSTPNSQLSTPNSQLPTPNSQLPTPNSQLSTPNSQLSTLNSQLSTPNSQLSTPNSQLSTPNSQLSTPFDTNTKMNPPLRSEDDVEAIRQGLSDGTIDAIATDHAPHTLAEKEQEYSKAPFGIIGLPTSLGLVLTELVDKGVLTLADALAKMTINPARILGLETDGLVAGARADIIIIDPEMEWVVDVNLFASKARNCLFSGWKLKGRAVMTIVEGKIVWEI